MGEPCSCGATDCPRCYLQLVDDEWFDEDYEPNEPNDPTHPYYG